LWVWIIVSIAIVALASTSVAAQGRPTILSVEPDHENRRIVVTGVNLGFSDPEAKLFASPIGDVDLPVIEFGSRGSDTQTLVLGIPDDCMCMSGTFKLTVTRQSGFDRGPFGRRMSSATVPVSLYPDVQRMGSLAATELYEVHRRVLWDVAWVKPDQLDGNGFYTYTDTPRSLVYGSHTLFLSPLKGYGIPELTPGTVRKVRLYVNYGHQWMCDGTPTIVIGSIDEGVEFSLPMISGHYGAQGANWSNFVTYDEDLFTGHKGIQVYLKDYVYGGNHCWGEGSSMGVMFRIEAVYYDEFVPSSIGG
jgi:hypothetical protein